MHLKQRRPDNSLFVHYGEFNEDRNVIEVGEISLRSLREESSDR